MKSVDYIIIGAGLGGLTLYRYLKDKDLLIIDPYAGGYKIGESIVPKLFYQPEFCDILDKVKQLPSSNEKHGTFLITDDTVASYPLGEEAIPHAMHVARSEMEQLLIDEWRVPVIAEKVISVDFEKQIVKTNKNEYHFNLQVIDNSGYKMIIANQENLVQTLWPAYSTWGYYNITNVDCQKFWDELKTSHKNYIRHDLGEKNQSKQKDSFEYPAKITIIKRIRKGLWLWQIPLFDEKILSVGLVSQDKSITKTEFKQLVELHHDVHYTLEAIEFDNSDEFHKLYSRQGYAKFSQVASNEKFILIGDAYSFADPVYSVGTALTVRQAREAATLILDGGWSKKKSQYFNEMNEEILNHAIDAFRFWYDEKIITNDDIATAMQEKIFHGDFFEFGFRESYESVLDDAVVEVNLPFFTDSFQQGMKIEEWEIQIIKYTLQGIRFDLRKQKLVSSILVTAKNNLEKYYKQTNKFNISYIDNKPNESFFIMLDSFIVILTSIEENMIVPSMKIKG